MKYREYRIVLINNKVIKFREKTSIPRQFSLIGEYEGAKQFDLVTLTDEAGNRILVPKRSIVAILEV